MRHEYHTPFGKPQKARGGGIAIRGTNFKRCSLMNKKGSCWEGYVQNR
jgi:hypothetical protein